MVLDVACGTGKSFLPLLERGYDVTACDISEAMLRVARTKVGSCTSLRRLVLGALPVLGRCDLPAYAESCDRVRVVRDLTGLEATAYEMAGELIGR